VKNRKNIQKSAWTSGKIPLMTKGGSLPARRWREFGMANLEFGIGNAAGNESLEGRPPCRP